MIERTNTDYAPWFIVDASVKWPARLNVISHRLNQVPHEGLNPEPIELPRRQEKGDYEHPGVLEYQFIPAVYP
jgi:hypothetical protein